MCPHIPLVEVFAFASSPWSARDVVVVSLQCRTNQGTPGFASSAFDKVPRNEEFRMIRFDCHINQQTMFSRPITPAACPLSFICAHLDKQGLLLHIALRASPLAWRDDFNRKFPLSATSRVLAA
jgi:hypothetical protein